MSTTIKSTSLNPLSLPRSRRLGLQVLNPGDVHDHLEAAHNATVVERDFAHLEPWQAVDLLQHTHVRRAPFGARADAAYLLIRCSAAPVRRRRQSSALSLHLQGRDWSLGLRSLVPCSQQASLGRWLDE